MIARRVCIGVAIGVVRRITVGYVIGFVVLNGVALACSMTGNLTVCVGVPVWFTVRLIGFTWSAGGTARRRCHLVLHIRVRRHRLCIASYPRLTHWLGLAVLRLRLWGGRIVLFRTVISRLVWIRRNNLDITTWWRSGWGSRHRPRIAQSRVDGKRLRGLNP